MAIERLSRREMITEELHLQVTNKMLSRTYLDLRSQFHSIGEMSGSAQFTQAMQTVT